MKIIPYFLMLFVVFCISVYTYVISYQTNLLISGRFPDIDNSICCYGINVIKVKALSTWSLRICANFVIIYTCPFSLLYYSCIATSQFFLGVIMGKFFYVIFKINRLNIISITASYGVKAFVSCVHNFISYMYLTCNRVNVHISVDISSPFH